MSLTKEASHSVNEFSMKLYSKLAKEKPNENLFYSPTSICIALAMTYAGAKGNTAKEVEQTMNWNRAEKVHEMMKEFQQSLFPSSGAAGIELKLANRLWAQSGFSTLKEFTKILQCCYEAELGVVDYQSKTKEARQTINNWVAEKTNDKIKDLLKQGTLSSETRLVLTNAVYFKGFWCEQFDESCTHDWNFKVTKTSKMKVKMMNQTSMFSYAENESLSCQVLELPYKENKIAMMILLPNEEDGLAKVEEKVSSDVLERCNEKMTYQEVSVSLPKFKVDCQLTLNQTLKDLGISELFSRNADLSGITGEKDLFVSNVIHQAFVDVNEEGTEAAAATAVAMNTFCLQEDEPPHFIADHPFFFAIKDTVSGAVLFMGRIIHPESNN